MPLLTGHTHDRVGAVIHNDSLLQHFSLENLSPNKTCLYPVKKVTENVTEGSPSYTDNPEGFSASEIQGVNQTPEMLAFSYWLAEDPPALYFPPRPS